MALTGCASGAGGDGTDLATAKATTLSIESKLAAYIPKSAVISTNQPKQSKVLFPCLHKDNESYWPNTMTVKLKPGVDTQGIFEAIAADWNSKPKWTVSQSTDGSTPTMTLVSDSGYSFSAEFVQGPVFTVTATSACFPSAGLSGKSSY